MPAFRMEVPLADRGQFMAEVCRAILQSGPAPDGRPPWCRAPEGRNVLAYADELGGAACLDCVRQVVLAGRRALDEGHSIALGMTDDDDPEQHIWLFVDGQFVDPSVEAGMPGLSPDRYLRGVWMNCDDMYESTANPNIIRSMRYPGAWAPQFVGGPGEGSGWPRGANIRSMYNLTGQWPINYPTNTHPWGALRNMRNPGGLYPRFAVGGPGDGSMGYAYGIDLSLVDDDLLASNLTAWQRAYISKIRNPTDGSAPITDPPTIVRMAGITKDQLLRSITSASLVQGPGAGVSVGIPVWEHGAAVISERYPHAAHLAEVSVIPLAAAAYLLGGGKPTDDYVVHLQQVWKPIRSHGSWDAWLARAMAAQNRIAKATGNADLTASIVRDLGRPPFAKGHEGDPKDHHVRSLVFQVAAEATRPVWSAPPAPPPPAASPDASAGGTPVPPGTDALAQFTVQPDQPQMVQGPGINVGGTAWTNQNVGLRSHMVAPGAPASSFQIVGTLPQWTQVQVTSQGNTGNAVWYHVQSGNLDGWVPSVTLSASPPAGAPSVSNPLPSLTMAPVVTTVSQPSYQPSYTAPPALSSVPGMPPMPPMNALGQYVNAHGVPLVPGVSTTGGGAWVWTGASWSPNNAAAALPPAPAPVAPSYGYPGAGYPAGYGYAYPPPAYAPPAASPYPYPSPSYGYPASASYGYPAGYGYGGGATDAYGNPYVDPSTGLPLAAGASPAVDPVTGLPVGDMTGAWTDGF